MPRRKREASTGTSTMVKRQKHNGMTLPLVDMDGICSRHTGLSVDYKKTCTAGPSQLCHVCKNAAAWNGFFLNVGLELREENCGALSLLGSREGVTIANMATAEEKTQAATLLYWLLTQHRCVVKAAINDDVFVGHEQVVCRALGGSKISALTLLQSSAKAATSKALVTAIRSMKHLVELNLMMDFPKLFDNLAPLLATTSSLKVLGVLSACRGMYGAKDFLEGLYQNKTLSSLSITTGLLQAYDSGRLPGLRPAGFARYLSTSRSLTSLVVISVMRELEVDVQSICQAVSFNSVMTRLDLMLFTLKEEFAAPVRNLLRSTKTLKYFSLTYKCVDELYHRVVIPGLARPLSHCLRCGTFHEEETDRITPWIQALLQESDSLNELRFSMLGFCTLECRAFLNALSKNTTLHRVTMVRLGQNDSEFYKFLTTAGVMDRVSADISYDVAYPSTNRLPRYELGQIENVNFCDLERTLFEVAACDLVTHVHLIVFSFLCLTRVTEPAASPLIQLIRRAPAMVTLTIQVDRTCCSRCWNQCAPSFCDAVLHNTTIRKLSVTLPQNPRMGLLPLAALLQRSRGLCQFMLEPPGPEAFSEFVRELSKPKLEENYNVGLVRFTDGGSNTLKEKLRIRSVVDRNASPAKRAADFIVGYPKKDTAEALERMPNCPLLVGELRSRKAMEKQQAVDLIDKKKHSMADMNEFMRLAGVIRDEIVCLDSSDGRTQLDDLNEYCLRHLRKYLKLSDIIDSHL